MTTEIILLIRSVILFLLTLLLIRVLGKGNPLRMTPYKFVTYMIIAIIIALTSTNVISNPIFAIIALSVWILLTIAVDYLCVKSKYIHDLINGKEIILIKDGKVMEENLLKVRATGEELLRELRTKNVFNLADVEFAVMESSGDLNVLLKSDKKPITPHDLQKKVEPSSEPQTVILDGNVIDGALTARGLNRNWLNTELEKIGVLLDNVFIGQLDTAGDLHIDLFDDTIKVPEPKVKELLYANIEKCQADLILFALETNNEKAKAMYLQNADKLKRIMDKLEPYLLR